MMSKQIAVPNSFVLLNIRELLLKSRSDVSGVLEELDALLNSRVMSGIISTSLDLMCRMYEPINTYQYLR